MIQGRLLAAAGSLLLTGVIWLVTFGTLGILGHVVAALEAAVWTDKSKPDA